MQVTEDSVPLKHLQADSFSLALLFVLWLLDVRCHALD